MIKKIFKLLKALIVGAIWTAFFVYIADVIMILIWNFDILNIRHWQVINTFWESGGKIKTGKDYTFVAMLIALVPLWLWGWRHFYKVSFLKVLLSPIVWYNNKMIKKYGEGNSRIVLKNLGTTKKKPNMDELIEQRLKQSNKPKDKASGKIRSHIQEKMTSTENK